MAFATMRERDPVLSGARSVERAETNCPADARGWAKILNGYRQQDTRRAVFELVVTVVPFLVLWGLGIAALQIGLWLTLLVAVPTAGFLMRLFIIQHDCGHGSFFADQRANDWTGRLLGVLTLTPYTCWRRGHAAHHATSGRLTQREQGDVYTMTVDEFRRHGPTGRTLYRVLRHPLFLFVVAPAFLFYVHNRLPFGLMDDRKAWISALGTTVAIVALLAGLGWMFGLGAVFMVHVPVTMLGASAGVWLFFVQHQFEHTSWSNDDTWDWHEAALHGSSNYQLPPVLRWMTGNIGLHHIHHLCSRIPFYRLSEVVRDYPELAKIGRLGLVESFACVRLTL